jgi:hypothetical protein
LRLGRRRQSCQGNASQPSARTRPKHYTTPRHGGRASECDGDGVLAGGCGGGGSASASGSASGSASAAAAEASRVVEGLPPHTGLQLRASFLFVDAWRGEPLRYSPHKTVQTLTALSRPAQPRAALTARCSPLQPPYRRLTALSQRPTATHSHLHPPPPEPNHPPYRRARLRQGGRRACVARPLRRARGQRRRGRVRRSDARAADAYPRDGKRAAQRQVCPLALHLQRLLHLNNFTAPARPFPPYTPLHNLIHSQPLLRPIASPRSSVNISFGSTLQPAAGGAGCEASWAVDNVEVHTR